jgi:ribosomal protein L31E
MPLGNLTSQFFANVYLNELDYFVKHKLRAKYYIRYVNDFVVLHSSIEQLEIWKSIPKDIDN